MGMFSEVQSDAPSCSEYMDNMSPAYKGGFLRQKNEYKLNPTVIQGLSKLLSFIMDIP